MATLTAGRVSTQALTPGAVPTGLIRAYGRPVRSDVEIAKRAASQFDWQGTQPHVVAFVLPTAAGDEAIVCRAPHIASVAECRRIALAASLTGSQPVVAVGVDKGLAVELKIALNPVQKASNQLNAARGADLKAQAQLDDALASADRSVVSKLRGYTALARERPAISGLVQSLRVDASKFDALADASASMTHYALSIPKAEKARSGLRASAAPFRAAGLLTALPVPVRLVLPPVPVPVLPTGPGVTTTPVGSGTPNGGGQTTTASTQKPNTSGCVNVSGQGCH
jgi:hypothetical protein